MKWFKEVFLPSFEDCKGKRISEKQGMIFEKYLDFTIKGKETKTKLKKLEEFKKFIGE